MCACWEHKGPVKSLWDMGMGSFTKEAWTQDWIGTATVTPEFMLVQSTRIFLLRNLLYAMHFARHDFQGLYLFSLIAVAWHASFIYGIAISEISCTLMWRQYLNLIVSLSVPSILPSFLQLLTERVRLDYCRMHPYTHTHIPHWRKAGVRWLICWV